MRATIVLLTLSGWLAACAGPSTASLPGTQLSAVQCQDLAAIGENEAPDRARLKSELAALADVGYDPVSEMDTYPESYQAAQQRINQRCRM
ncbi:hypothetical protein [Caballeronia sp. LZ034LL]|uniref:hypothetical protein n=1 Tax=Caballeronia sp. LZ034LL TaxID=3038567 RepID=UPI00285C69A4|nr:hypothetical protein [Caballeronia sp. LZ034LL]MDR5839036.1 hypothetical protein [Caballeronia sp. LZ034LL]